MDIHSEIGRANAVERGGVRLLHPLNLVEGLTGEGNGRGPYVGVAVDCETTSLDWKTGKIIELAVRRFKYQRDGIITEIDRPYQWRQDPGEPLTEEVSRLTGLTDVDLVGEEIDEDGATKLLRSASFVVAHNSSFDRRWIEKQLPDAAGLRWCCSMSQIDWRRRGFDGKALGYLLVQNGFYFCGHRAANDVDAMIQMLRHRDEDGVTALAEMIEHGSKPTWLVRAKGAHFDRKDLLRARGYRWDTEREPKAWCREVADDDLVPEQFWLAAHVYSVAANPWALGPDIIRVTAQERFL